METLYQTIDRTGISIPLEVVRAYGLPEGTRIAISWQGDSIRVVPVEVGAEEIENRSLRYLLKNIGDALAIGTLQRTTTGQWVVPVMVADTDETIGQLCYTVAGVLVPEKSTPIPRLFGEGGDGA